jgi:adenylate cyclase
MGNPTGLTTDVEGLLVARLHRAEVSDVSIDRAIRDGRLPTLAVEVALGDGAEHTLSTVARGARLRSHFVRELMQALGRPDPGRGEKALTDEDLELAQIAREMLDAGLPAEELIEVTRVIGLAMSQSADAVRRMVADAFLKPGDSEAELGARYVDAVDKLGPLLPTLFALSFRAHLRDGINGQLLSEAERQQGRLADTEDVAVAFADLVGYTRLGDGISNGGHGSIAGRFAAEGVAAACRPVRLVKTIGDALMFVSPDTRELLEVLLDLRARVHGAEPELPELRIGVACGPATPRAGDWFGTSVNLASRVVEHARPGQLLATEEFAVQVGGQNWKKGRKRNLKGFERRQRLCSYQPAS